MEVSLSSLLPHRLGKGLQSEVTLHTVSPLFHVVGNGFSNGGLLEPKLSLISFQSFFSHKNSL